MRSSDYNSDCPGGSVVETASDYRAGPVGDVISSAEDRSPAETMPVHISDAARVLATTLKRPAFGESSLFGFMVVVSFMFVVCCCCLFVVVGLSSRVLGGVVFLVTLCLPDGGA